MTITRQADYAVRLVLCLARTDGRKVMTVDEVSKECFIPKSFTAKIFQRLSHAGITSSRRGVRGGFVLARNPRDISLLQVVEAIDGPLEVNRCVIDNTNCDLNATCVIHPVWVDIHRDIIHKLKSVTFEYLRNQPIPSSLS